MSRMRWTTLSRESANCARMPKPRIARMVRWNGRRPSPAADMSRAASVSVRELKRSDSAPLAKVPTMIVALSVPSTSVPCPVETPRCTSRIETRLRPIEPTLFVKAVSRTGRLCRKAAASKKDATEDDFARSVSPGGALSVVRRGILRHRGQQPPELGGRLKSLLGVRLQAPVDQRVQLERNARQARRRADVALGELGLVRALVRAHAGDHLVEHRAQREHVVLLLDDA